MDITIQRCIELREATSNVIANSFGDSQPISEFGVSQGIADGLRTIPDVLESGWYEPPPKGVAVLFGKPQDEFARTRFDTFRNNAYWPSVDQEKNKEMVAILYASPISANGIIGDWGGTVYTGTDTNVIDHLKLCLDTVEEIAGFSEAGMEYGDISRFADKLLIERQLSTDRTVLTNGKGAAGTNCGHTIPWTDQPPTEDELGIIVSGDQVAVNGLISSKRIFVNSSEKARIPPTGAFTAELRLESLENSYLPNVFFHLIVCLERGKKTVVSNYNSVFDLLGMQYIRSKF